MQLNNSDLELVRTKSQYSDLYLSVFQPRTIFQAKINNPSGTHGDRLINYNTVTLGSYLSIESGMTMLVGTTLGGDDVGRIRVRSATASQIVVSENSNIEWKNSLFLTVLRYWEVWPVYPRIINDPNNPVSTLWYKDYDIAYTNQNTVLGTFLNAGPHRAINLQNGSAQLWYSSTGTYNLLGNSLTYDWAFEGGTPTGSTSADPGYVTYNQAGDYVTRLTVTNPANGSTDTTYRYVSVHASPQYPRWELKSLEGSRSEGGYRAQVVIYDTVSIKDNAIVVLYSDDYYGATQKSLGGNYPNSSSIWFSGYVVKDTIQYDYQLSTVTFEVASITDIMKATESFSVSVQSKASPTQWYELYDLDNRRALYHYLRWHSTVLSVADFQFVGTDQKLQFADYKRDSLYSALDTLMKNTLVGEVVCDRQGKIWAEITAATPNATGTFAPVMSISTRDWMNSPSIDEIYNKPLSYLEYGGIAYSGVSTGTFSALMACAPGNAPAFRGKPEILEGLALSDQNQLNTMVGNVAGNRNAQFPLVKMDLSGNYSNLDIAPQEAIQVVITPSDTVKNISINAPHRSERHTWRWDGENKAKLLNIELSPIISAPAGESIIIPVVAPDAGFGTGGGGGITLPPLPTIPPFTLGFSNQSITKWHGILASDPINNLPLRMSAVDFSYVNGGFFTGVTGSASNIGQVSSHGIYHINLMIQNTINVSQPTTIDILMYGNHFAGLYRHQSIPTNSSQTFVISDYYEYDAGEFIHIESQGGSTGAGVFYLTVELAFSLL